MGYTETSSYSGLCNILHLSMLHNPKYRPTLQFISKTHVDMLFDEIMCEVRISGKKMGIILPIFLPTMKIRIDFIKQMIKKYERLVANENK